MAHMAALFTLLISFALAALIPSAAFAHHCKGPHAGDEGCDSGGDGGGDGSGGFGSLGTGCVAFENPAILGTFHDDDGGAYCHGSDGQVSVPKRFRLDTKKFNGNERKYYLSADSCEADSPVCNGTVEVGILQSQLLHRWIDDELVATGEEELDFQAMATGEIARVSVDLAAGNKTRVLFGNSTGARMTCPPPSQAAPVWVECLDDSNEDGFCDLWTMSTQNLEGTAEPDARACLKESAKRFEVLLDGEITADFTLDICVIGVSCP